MALDRTQGPIDDADSTYNYRTHRYVLTRGYIDSYHKRLGIPIDTIAGGEDRANFVLQEISRQVYRWMYTQLLNNSRPILEFLIAYDTDRREAMIQAMGAQYDYFLISRGNLIANQSGINQATGTVIDPEILAKMKVSTEVKETLDSMGMTNRRLRTSVTQEDLDLRGKAGGY